MTGFTRGIEDEPGQEIIVVEPLTRDENFDTLTALQDLQQYVIRDLLRSVRNGTANEKELALAVRLLKDNGITLLPVDFAKTIDPTGKRQAVPHLPPKTLPDFSSHEVDDGPVSDSD